MRADVFYYLRRTMKTLIHGAEGAEQWFKRKGGKKKTIHQKVVIDAK